MAHFLAKMPTNTRPPPIEKATFVTVYLKDAAVVARELAPTALFKIQIPRMTERDHGDWGVPAQLLLFLAGNLFCRDAATFNLFYIDVEEQDPGGMVHIKDGSTMLEAGTYYLHCEAAPHLAAPATFPAYQGPPLATLEELDATYVEHDYKFGSKCPKSIGSAKKYVATRDKSKCVVTGTGIVEVAHLIPQGALGTEYFSNNGLWADSRSSQGTYARNGPDHPHNLITLHKVLHHLLDSGKALILWHTGKKGWFFVWLLDDGGDPQNWGSFHRRSFKLPGVEPRCVFGNLAWGLTKMTRRYEPGKGDNIDSQPNFSHRFSDVENKSISLLRDGTPRAGSQKEGIARAEAITRKRKTGEHNRLSTAPAKRAKQDVAQEIHRTPPTSDDTHGGP